MLQGIENYLEEDIAPAAVNKNDITHMLHKYDDVETPFGKIVSSFEFCPTPTDEPEAITYLNPFALLWWLSQISYKFYTFLSKALPTQIGRTVFYTDEVFPANSERRPDKGRAFYAFYWTILELPDWFRSRSEIPYFVFAYVPSKLIANQFSLTRLFKKIIHVFFAQDGFNLATTGVRIEHKHHQFVLRLKYGATIMDEEAFRSLMSVKGHSGFKPCLSCQNVVSRVGSYEEFHDDYLVHVLSPESDRFLPHTADTFKVMCNNISTAVLEGRPKYEVERLEQIYGVNYVEDGVLFDDNCIDVMRFPEDANWDPMHVLFTHGGVGQYHCNGFIKKLVDNGIELIELDTWTSNIQIPNYQFIKPGWIIDRFVYSDAANIKAFASDCIAMIDCISLFVQAVLVGTDFYIRLLPYM